MELAEPSGAPDISFTSARGQILERIEGLSLLED